MRGLFRKVGWGRIIHETIVKRLLTGRCSLRSGCLLLPTSCPSTLPARPPWPETAAAPRRIVSNEAPDTPLFQDPLGAPLTRDWAAYLPDKYVRCASEPQPNLRTRRVTPHVMCHSCVVALQAGVDVIVGRDTNMRVGAALRRGHAP